MILFICSDGLNKLSFTVISFINLFMDLQYFTAHFFSKNVFLINGPEK